MTNFTITSNAKIRLQELISNKPEALGVVIDVKSGGCAGYKFSFDYLLEDTKTDGSTLYEFEGLKVLVHDQSCSKIQGLELDYVQDNFGHKFVFNNTKNACGCGKSFGV